jgi:phage terminase small subunit
MALAEAYLGAGYKTDRRSARNCGCRLLKHPHVIAYLNAIRQAQAEKARLSVAEILAFCARVVRTGIGDLDASAGSDTGDLIKSYSSNEGELGSSMKMEKHDPFKAIETHLKLSGEDPATNALQELATALGSLGGSLMPTEKM